MEKKNRWLIAASAVGIHISIGSVYAYSVMTLPLNQLHGWQKGDITLAFSIAILFLGFSAAFLGRRVERMGPRKSGRMSAIFYSLGIMGSGLAVKIGSLPLFIFCYGVIGGIGLGVGYITPVSTLVKWFPDRRGLATGMAIMGFGFAAMIFGPIMAKLFLVMDIWKVYFLLGAIYFCLIFGSSLYIAPPPPGWLPPGFSAEGQGTGGKIIRKDLAQLTVNEAIRTRRFYFMWIMLFINITCGIALQSPVGRRPDGARRWPGSRPCRRPPWSGSWVCSTAAAESAGPASPTTWAGRVPLWLSSSSRSWPSWP